MPSIINASRESKTSGLLEDFIINAHRLWLTWIIVADALWL
jgi:hypothetical protein